MQKIPLVKGWSEPNPDVSAWWADVPDDVNKAIRLDGFVMVDTDNHELANWFREQIAEHHWPVPIEVKTPRGVHFYWRTDETVPSFVLEAPFEGDIRVKSGAGQYALVSPSRTPMGEYRGDPLSAPWASTVVIQDLGDLRGSLASQAAVQGVSGRIPEGMRNTALTGFAGLMRRYGFDDEALGRVLNGLNHQLTDDPLPDEEIQGIIRSAGRWDATEFSVFDMDTEVVEKSDDILSWSYDLRVLPPPEWLWRPYIPMGRLVLLDGDEGIGKGMFCAWMATQVVNGSWGEPGNVLWASSEDDPEEDIKRRLIAAGMRDGAGHGIGFFNDWPQFPRHIPPVEKLIELHSPRLMVLDPGRSFIRREDGEPMSYNDEAAVRPAMEQLNKMAKATGCTIIFVHHWNKDSQGSVRSRAGGSKAFTQVVRHRISVARVGQGDNAEWAMEVTKSNIAKDGGLRSYHLEEHKETETALFVPGDPLPSFSGLGAWVRDREKEHNNASVAIDYVDLAESAFAHLEPGSAMPRALLESAGVPRDQVPMVLDELSQRGLVQKGGPGVKSVWLG